MRSTLLSLFGGVALAAAVGSGISAVSEVTSAGGEVEVEVVSRLAPPRTASFQTIGASTLARTAKFQGKDESMATKLREGPSVAVGGQVARPGPIRWNRKLTVEGAVESAGGLTPFGNPKRITLTRAGKSETFDWVDLEGRSRLLQPDDTLVVPEKMVFGR